MTFVLLARTQLLTPCRYRVCDQMKVKKETPLEKAYLAYLNAMHQAAFSVVEEVSGDILIGNWDLRSS